MCQGILDDFGQETDATYLPPDPPDTFKGQRRLSVFFVELGTDRPNVHLLLHRRLLVFSKPVQLYPVNRLLDVAATPSRLAPGYIFHSFLYDAASA